MKFSSSLEELLFCEYEALTAVYDRRSGQTHILAPASIEILRSVDQKALCKRAMVEALLQGFDIDSPDDPKSVLNAYIDELDDLGLLHPVL